MLNPNVKRKYQLIIGFSILGLAVIVSYFSVYEIDVQVLPQYDIFLVIDVSGSMNSEEKIIFAKQAALEFVDEFHLEQSSEHRIGLVSFANTGNLLVQLDTNVKNNLRHGINNLNPDGATAMGDGIAIATESFLQDTRPDTEKVIVLLSDGMSNTGSNPLITAQTANDNDVKIFSVGYGFGADVQTLKAVASLTNGKFFNAPTGEDLAATFNEIADVLITPISHYSSRILILIAIPILLFLPTIERGLTSIMRKTEVTHNQRLKIPKRDNESSYRKDNLKTLSQSKCPNCNTFFKSNFKFCPKCGAGVAPFPISLCSACNTSLIQNSKFCANCGMSVKGKVI